MNGLGTKILYTVPAYFFLPIRKQRAKIAISLCRHLLSFSHTGSYCVHFRFPDCKKLKYENFRNLDLCLFRKKIFAPIKITNHMAFFNVLRVVSMCTCIPTALTMDHCACAMAAEATLVVADLLEEEVMFCRA